MFHHPSGGSWAAVYQAPQETLKKLSAHPKEGSVSLSFPSFSPEPRTQHLQLQDLNENSRHGQKFHLTTLHCCFPAQHSPQLSSLASKPSTVGPHTSSTDLPWAPHNLHPGWCVSPRYRPLEFPHPIHVPGPKLILPSRSLPFSSSGSHGSPSLSAPWLIPHT